jgi:hypothetical protein
MLLVYTKEKIMKFYEWVFKCCDLLGKSKEQGVDLLPESDPGWFWAFEDGLTPEQAVEKYKQSFKKDT